MAIGLASDQEGPDIYREKLEQTPDLPIGITFHSVLLMLDHDNENYPEHAVFWIQDELGIDETDSTAFLS